MKRFIPYSLLAAAAACGIALGQAYTTPVGYVTEEIKATSFNLIGITLHEPSIVSGVITGVTSESISASAVDFSDILTPSLTYILEITNGSSEGLIQEIASWSGSDLTTVDDLSPFVTADTTTFTLRPAATISSIFGSSNEAGLLEGTATTADIIWVPNAVGGFDQFFRQPASPPFVPEAQWAKVGSPGSFANNPLVYVDGVFIQRRGATDIDLVITGEVKTTDTTIAIAGSAFNYIGATYPVGSTLDNSNLASFLQSGTATTADIIWMPNSSGGYNQFFYQPASPPFVPEPQWVQIGVPGNSGSAEITSGFIVQRRGGTASATISAPESYDDL